MKRRLGKMATYAGLLGVLLIVASCGDGGGGKSTGPSFAGTYSGTASSTVTGPGASVPASGSLKIVVGADNTVSWVDSAPTPIGTGTLTGNTFVITAPGSKFNSSGVSCGGSVLLNGTINGTTMSGTISSSGLTCNGQTVTITGTFTATLLAEVPRGGTGDGIVERIRDAVRRQ